MHYGYNLYFPISPSILVITDATYLHVHKYYVHGPITHIYLYTYISITGHPIRYIYYILEDVSEL